MLGTLEGAARADGRLEVIDTHKVQSRKPVTQLRVLVDKQLMLCLADATVSVYSLPDFELRSQLTRSKGSNLFDWHETRGTLCVATKRRLLIYHHDGRDFVEVREVPVNDIVRCLTWCGDALCLGLRKEYLLVDPTTGVTTEVFPTGRSSNPIILPVFSLVTHAGEEEVQELLLARDNVGIFVGADGKPTRKHGLPWTETPIAAATLPPYAVAALPSAFEVRNLQPGSQYGLVQTLPLKGVTGIVVGCGGCGVHSASSEGNDMVLYAFTPTSVTRLRGVPIPSQVAQLLDAGQFEAALLLCDLLVHAPALRAELTRTAHLRCAHESFAGGLYDDAMRHFGAAGASPLEVLALFPGLLPPALGAVVERHARVVRQGEESVPPREALAALVPLLLGTRTRLRSSTGPWGPEPAGGAHGPGGDGASVGALTDDEAAALDTATLRAMVATEASTEAILALLEPPTAVDPVAGERTLVEGGRHVELVALYRAVGQHRRALQLLQRLATASSMSSTLSPDKGARGAGSGGYGPRDTVAYLRAMKPSDPLLTLEFSRWLLREQPGAETLELFTAADPPLPAEDVLPHLRVHAPQLCIPYLEHEVAVRGAELPMEFHNDLVLLYLAELTRAKAAMGEGGWNEETCMPDMRRRLLALLRAPAATSRYHPERMLSRFPQDAFFEERATLLSRIGRHDEALTILVRQLKNPQLAEEYCDRVWGQTHASPGPGDMNSAGDHCVGVLGEVDEWLAVNGNDNVIEDDEGSIGGVAARAADNVYHSLLRIYLEEPSYQAGAAARSSSESWLKEALGLMTRRHKYIDAMMAVQLLPDDVPLQEVMPFLEAKIQSSAQLQHRLDMHKDLVQSQLDEVDGEIRRFKARSFVVTDEATCCVCHKKIATSVFAVHPDGSLVHYNCLNR